MSVLVFGDSNFVSKAAELFDAEENVSIVIKGWRKKLLLPYVREVGGVPDSGGELTKPKFGFIVRLFWLGPLMACYGLALERNMHVNIKEAENNQSATLIFSSEKQYSTD